jgi:hypothetical protein
MDFRERRCMCLDLLPSLAVEELAARQATARMKSLYFSSFLTLLYWPSSLDFSAFMFFVNGYLAHFGSFFSLDFRRFSG